MCVIIDTNTALDICNGENEVFRPVVDWLTGKRSNGRLVIGGNLKTELEIPEKMANFIASLNRAGRTITISSDLVDNEIHQLEMEGLCTSNDLHVIAIARLSGARVLCTLDAALREDFKNKRLVDNPRGKIYSRSAHRNILRHVNSCRKNLGSKT